MKITELQKLLSSTGELTPKQYDALIAAWVDIYDLLIQTPLWRTTLALARTRGFSGFAADDFHAPLAASLVENEAYNAYRAIRATDSFGAHLERQHRAFILRIEVHRAAASLPPSVPSVA